MLSCSIAVTERLAKQKPRDKNTPRHSSRRDSNRKIKSAISDGLFSQSLILCFGSAPFVQQSFATHNITMAVRRKMSTITRVACAAQDLWYALCHPGGSGRAVARRAKRVSCLPRLLGRTRPARGTLPGLPSWLAPGPAAAFGTASTSEGSTWRVGGGDGGTGATGSTPRPHACAHVTLTPVKIGPVDLRITGPIPRLRRCALRRTRSRRSCRIT